MKTLILGFFLFFFFDVALGQWAAVSSMDFNEEKAFAFSGGKSYYKFKKAEIFASKDGMVKKIYARLHILDEKGVDELSKVSLLFRRRSDIVKNIEGRTINFENGELAFDELSSKEIYSNQRDKEVSELIFALPRVRIGSIIEYTYTLITDNYFSTTWYFQGELPNQYSEVTFSAGTNFHYQPLIQAADQSKISRNIDRETATFFQENIPAARDETFVPNQEDYLPKVMFQLVGINANGSVQPIFKDWEDLTKSVLNNPQVGNLRKASKKLYARALASMNPSQTPFEVMTEICKHVHDHVDWNGYHSFIAKDSRKPLEIYESGSGNSGEVNMVLNSLLRSAGLDATLCS